MGDSITMTEPRRYRAFISYAHEDQRWAKWLLGAIETYRIPADVALPEGWTERRVRPVFLDRAELASAGHLDEQLLTSLQNSDALLLLCSPAAVASERVQQEIREFARLGRAARIFPLMVAGHPLAEQRGYPPETECLPIALRELHASPLAADLRPGKGNKREARLRLIAGLLGVRFDALQRRDERRRSIRQWSIVAASLAIALLTSGLGLYAWRARNEAERQRLRSEQTADFLKELLQGADPNQALGREFTARDLVDQGADRLARSRLDPLLRSDMQFLLANVYYALGTPDRSQAQVDAALATLARDANGSRAHADALEWAALLAMDGGRPKDAIETQRRVVAMREQLGDAEGVLASRSFLGDLMVRDGQRSEGMVMLEQALREQQRTKASELEQARSHNRLGVAQQEYGDPQAAVAHFEASLRLHRKLFGDVHPEVATLLNNLALANKNAGRFAEAERTYADCIAMRRKLYGDDHPLVARALANLAALQRDQGDPVQALDTFAKARAVLEKSVGARHPDVATNLYNTGATLFKMNRYAEAIPFFTQAAEQRAEFHGARHWRTAQVYGYRGQAFMALGRDAAAMQDLGQAVSMFGEAYGAEHVETLFMRAWIAEAHLIAGRYARARDEYAAILRIAAAAKERDASLCGGLALGLAEATLALGDTKAAAAWAAKARADMQPNARRWPLLLNLEGRLHPDGPDSPAARAMIRQSFEQAGQQRYFPEMLRRRMRPS